MKKKIFIFDTTLRDGEQVPGSQLNTIEKVQVAQKLEKLGVDIIEAGFPISSPTDMQSVKEISKVVKNSRICALSRGVSKDIDAAYEAVKAAGAPRIHTFLPVSPIQMEFVLRKRPEEVLELIKSTVGYAKKYISDVEWSGMDASRADFDFLVKACKVAINAGATTINIPDTVGYAVPDEFGELVKKLVDAVPEFRSDVVLSVHVHNDLGLATANSLSGVLNGATQVECTINGVGERAGNSALEEIAMILKTRYRSKYETGIHTKQIASTSKMISTLMHMPVQKNKAIVGAHAFAHSSGIHQDGVLKHRSSFEVISPEDVGVDESSLVLTARSGRAALKHHLSRLGYKLSKDEVDEKYSQFLVIADKKKEVSDEELHILMGQDHKTKRNVTLEVFHVVTGTNPITPSATVSLKVHGNIITKSAIGNGPVDASFRAVNDIVGKSIILNEYLVQAITGGSNDLGKVNVKVTNNSESYYGFGADTDVLVASVKAYVDAVSKIS
ncbi:MAG: 2-isopropylmalate synthase [Patescibacteria group bacterium]